MVHSLVDRSMLTSSLRLAMIFLSVLVMITSVAFAHSVTMNFRFNIVDRGDTIRVSDTSYTNQAVDLSFTNLPKPYISAESSASNTLVALVYAGSLVRAAVNTQSNPYIFQLTQDEGQNRFLIALTRGNWSIVDRIQAKVPATTFGGLAVPDGVTSGFVLQLQFDAIDLTGLLTPGQILVRALSGGRLPAVSLQST